MPYIGATRDIALCRVSSRSTVKAGRTRRRGWRAGEERTQRISFSSCFIVSDADFVREMRFFEGLIEV